MNQGTKGSILILLLAGCTTARKPVMGPPTSPLPQPVIEVSDNGPWKFAYRSDTILYQISRSAAVESQTDSGVRREVATNNTHEVVTITVVGDTISYSATVDTFSTATQGLIGSVQQVSLPVQISGAIDSISAVTDSAGPVESCDPVRSSLQSDVRNILINFPAHLSPGLSWRDSTVRMVCYGTIPLKATVIRKFSVVGGTSYDSQRAVAIQRTDSISAHGEGRQQQHRLIIDAVGTGGATYYLSSEQSRVLQLMTTQDIDFAIQTSGRTSHFRESAKEEYSLLR